MGDLLRKHEPKKFDRRFTNVGKTFAALSGRNYRIYFTGTLVSHTGTWLQDTAQIWLVLLLTGSGSALGVTVALQMLPTLFLSPAAGLLADRVSKRKLVAIMQILLAVPSAILGILAVTGAVQEWHVYVLALIFGVARAFEAPARQAFVKELVEPSLVTNAIALNSGSFTTARLIGPGIAGLLIAAFGSGVLATGIVILLNAVSFTFVFFALMSLDAEELRPSKPVARARGGIREGARYVASQPNFILLFAVSFFIGAFGLNFQVLGALMTTEVFGLAAQEFGILGSIVGIGSIIGVLFAASRTQARMRSAILAGMVFSIAQCASAFMPTYWSFAALLPIIGCSTLLVSATVSAVIQTTARPEMNGRVISLYLMVFLGSVPFGSTLLGWLAEHYGARLATFASGAIAGMGILIAVALYSRAMKRSRRTREESVLVAA